MSHISHLKEPNNLLTDNSEVEDLDFLIQALKAAKRYGFEYQSLGSQAILPLLNAMVDLSTQISILFKEEEVPTGETINQEPIEIDCQDDFENHLEVQSTKFVWVGRKHLPSVGPDQEMANIFKEQSRWLVHLINALQKPKFDTSKFAFEQNAELFRIYRRMSDWIRIHSYPRFSDREYGKCPSLWDGIRRRKMTFTLQYIFDHPEEKRWLKEILSHVDGITRKEARKRETTHISRVRKLSQVKSTSNMNSTATDKASPLSVKEFLEYKAFLKAKYHLRRTK